MKIGLLVLWVKLRIAAISSATLSLDIMPSGSKIWRYAYRTHGKQKTFTIGKYPDTSFISARTSRDKAKKMVSAGIDPSQQKQIIKRQITDG